MTQLHSTRTANHRPYADVYADAAARLAATGFVRALGGGVVPFDANDLYKKVLQLDNASEWILTAITPTWARAGGFGDVAGPASATDNALARFDSTTGKLIQSSAVTLDDVGAITVPEMAAPSTPGANKVSIYAKSDGKLYIKDDAGTETDLTATGSGDVVGQASSIDSEIALFSGTGGKTIKRATGSGLVKATSGVYSTVAAPSGAVVGDTDAQTLTSKTLTTPVIAQINDANGNEALKLGSTASAVNEVTITNKSTGNAPTVEATGGDTNISLNLKSKGTGSIQANGLDIATSDSQPTLTDGATVTWATGGVKYPNATVTLAGNRTLAITGTVAGQSGTLVVKQDATGSRTLTLPAGSKVRDGGAGAITLSTVANAIDILSYYYDGTNYFWTYGKNYT